MFDDTASRGKRGVQEIVTLWLALDDITEEVGPLEFCEGSHLWKTEYIKLSGGTVNNFFSDKNGKPTRGEEEVKAKIKKEAGEEPSSSNPDELPTPPNPTLDYKSVLHSTAKAVGIEESTLKFTNLSGTPAGGGSLHYGSLFHGSSENKSDKKVRRGIGIHFFRGDLKWDVEEARKSRFWKDFVEADVAKNKHVDGTNVGGCDICEEHFPFVYRPFELEIVRPDVRVTEKPTVVGTADPSPIEYKELLETKKVELAIKNDIPSIKQGLKNHIALQLIGDDKEPKVCGVDCGRNKKCKQHNVNECSDCGERCGRYKRCSNGCKTTKRKR